MAGVEMNATFRVGNVAMQAVLSRQMASRIRQLREDLNRRVPGEYTQAALARRLDVAANTVRAWETGAARPRKAMAKRIARVLGVKVEELGLDDQALDADHQPVGEDSVSDSLQ